ncbi:hypothetical protein V496_01441 [Pseudogymnoascus sp. VKM F-4515 (FW-2607)]|nr:hypothetical protein V496_01441 [Pseudogymnoascus sp. VKM F-4515 (FW-2607)]
MRFPVVKVMTESMLVAYVEGKRASPRPAKRRALPWASNSEYVQVPIVGWILQPSSGMSKQLFVFRAEEDKLERRPSQPSILYLRKWSGHSKPNPDRRMIYAFHGSDDTCIKPQASDACLRHTAASNFILLQSKELTMEPHGVEKHTLVEDLVRNVDRVLGPQGRGRHVGVTDSGHSSQAFINFDYDKYLLYHSLDNAIKKMDTISKNDLAIAALRDEEKYHKIESEFSADFDNALENFKQGKFKLCASILIKCFRIAEGGMHKEEYMVCNPIRFIDVGVSGGGSYWDESKSYYYLDIAIDTIHDASIAIHTEKNMNESVVNLLADLKDPLGKSLEAATTTTKAAFILSQICLRKIRLSYLDGFDSQNKRQNKVAAMIYVMTFANDDQTWKKEYGLESIKCVRDRAYGHRRDRRGLKWIGLSSYDLRTVEELKAHKPRPEDKCEKIQQLTSYGGSRCLHPQCDYATRRPRKMGEHWASAHNRKAAAEYSGTPLWEEFTLQTYFTSPGRIDYSYGDNHDFDPMDLEQPKTPVMTDENVAIAADLRNAANALIGEKTMHGQTARRLQSQLDGFEERDLQLRANVRALQHTNTALAQEILRLRWTVDTLNTAMQASPARSFPTPEKKTGPFS